MTDDIEGAALEALGERGVALVRELCDVIRPEATRRWDNGNTWPDLRAWVHDIVSDVKSEIVSTIAVCDGAPAELDDPIGEDHFLASLRADAASDERE